MGWRSRIGSLSSVERPFWWLVCRAATAPQRRRPRTKAPEWYHAPKQHGTLRAFARNAQEARVNDDNYRTWMCIICGWTYDERRGCPEEGLPPGTRWEDIPDDWICPDCGASKDDFEMVEI